MLYGDGDMANNPPPKEVFDAVDRQELPASEKLAMLCNMVREQTGADPRSGGWYFIGTPLVIATVLKELPAFVSTLIPKMQVGRGDGRDDQDAVFMWSGVKFRVRHMSKGDVLHAVREGSADDIPSSHEDRQVASELRFTAWRDRSV